MSRKLNSLEEKLMLAMGLKDVRELDRMLAAPISKDAEAHSEPPEEESEWAERTYDKEDRWWDAQERFAELSETRYLN